jgi:hypothetical protein
MKGSIFVITNPLPNNAFHRYDELGLRAVRRNAFRRSHVRVLYIEVAVLACRRNALGLDPGLGGVM